MLAVPSFSSRLCSPSGTEDNRKEMAYLLSTYETPSSSMSDSVSGFWWDQPALLAVTFLAIYILPGLSVPRRISSHGYTGVCIQLNRWHSFQAELVHFAWLESQHEKNLASDLYGDSEFNVTSVAIAGLRQRVVIGMHIFYSSREADRLYNMLQKVVWFHTRLHVKKLNKNLIRARTFIVPT